MNMCKNWFIFLTLILMPMTVLAFSPPSGSPLAKREHPRLFFTENQLTSIKERINRYYKTEFQDFVSVMDNQYSKSISSKEEPDRYFDTRNYAFLCVIDPASLGVSHQHTRQQYCTKAVEHALAIPDSCNDARHDFSNWWNKGGCKMSAGLTYDWTYHQVTESQRQELADKVVALYDSSISDLFPPYDGGKPMISNKSLPYMHGIIFGSLAIWGDPYVSASKGQEMLDNMGEVFLTRVTAISDYLYGPDRDGKYGNLWGSGNPEGSGYGYSIFPAYMYPIAAASTALGIDYFETSPFTKFVPLFYYYKLHPFPVDGQFHYGWHDTGTEKDANYPVGCDNEECKATRPRMLRLWAYNLRKSDPTMAGLASWMVGTSDFRVPLTNYKHADGVRHYGLFGMFLGGERDILPISPQQAGLPLFKRMGDWTMFKSSHDLYHSTYLEIDSPIWNYKSGHNAFMPTSLQMSKYGTLLLKIINGKNGGSCPDASHGSKPMAGSITGPYTNRFMEVGKLNLEHSQQTSPGMITEGSNADVGDIIIFDSQPGIYDVFGYDYSRMYLDEFVADEAVQQMVYIRGPENHEFFVEFNHILSNFENRKILHTPVDIGAVGGSWSSQGSGSWSGNVRTYTITNTYAGSHGRLFITSLWPAQANFVKFGGAGHEWVDADGTPVMSESLNAACRNFAGHYTLQVRTDEPDFVTVYQPGDSQTLTGPASTQLVSAMGMKGVKVEDTVVLFSRTPLQAIQGTSYTVQTGQKTRHILVGFAPLTTYDVHVNSTVQQVTTSKGGVLSFVDIGTGSRQISVGGGVQTSQTSPSPARNLRIVGSQ